VAYDAGMAIGAAGFGVLAARIEDDVGGQSGPGSVVDPRALRPMTAGRPMPGITGRLFDELVDTPDAGQGLDLLD
jgi:hypothetical protein